MTGITIAWGAGFAALCAGLGTLAGWPLGYRRGHAHAEEEARWREQDRRWKRAQAEAARPVPVRPPVPERGGRHRHPGGEPRHAALPTAGYLPAPEPGPRNGTITMPAQPPPWDLMPPAPEPARWPAAGPEPEPEPVLEPTAVLPGQPETDTAWSRRQAADLQAYMDALMERSETYLKAITR